VKARMTVLAIGVAVIIIALILGGVQDLHIANVYGSVENKWYFYGAIGAIFLIGIILVAWGLLKKDAPKQSNPQ
jgi:NADH:ubiquinone oxidoreductase subunit 6 (subunit J)